ncbi:hypothetical protein D3C71_1488920 [compost metagenome]
MVFHFVAVGSGHTTATDADVFQLRTKARENRRPLRRCARQRRDFRTVAEQIPGFAAALFRDSRLQRSGQPFVNQHNAEITAFVAQRLFVLIAIAEHQRRIDADHRHTQLRDAVQKI